MVGSPKSTSIVSGAMSGLTAPLVPHLTIDELLTCTPVVRKRLDLTRAVPRQVIEECIDIAVQAPTASNRQELHWVVVTDAEQRRALAEIFLRPRPDYVSIAWPDYTDDDIRLARQQALSNSGEHLRAHFHEIPAIVIPCHLGRVDEAPLHAQAALWGSVYPAVWNFLLALRSRGLGAAWTTSPLYYEQDIAELVGIPYERYTLAGLYPIGYTIGTNFKRSSRRPLSEIVHWEQWGSGSADEAPQ